jgi:hypothetical protein
MIRWLLVVFITLVLFNGLVPFLRRWGLRRLPGDFEFRLFGRQWSIPLATSILLSLLAGFIAKLI